MADRRGLVLGVVAVAVGLDRRDREAVLRVRPDQVLGAEVGRVRRLRAVAKGHDDLRRALVVRLVRRPDQILYQPNFALGVLLPEALPQQPRARRVRLVHVLVRLVRLADWIRDVLAGDDARPRPGVVEGDGEAQLLEQRVARLREGRLVLAVLSFQRVVARLRLLELVARHVARRSPINIVDRLAGLGVPVLVVAGGAAHGFFCGSPCRRSRGGGVGCFGAGAALCVCRARGQPFATLKSVLLPGEPGRVVLGVGAGRASELEVYPRRYIAGLPAGVKDLCEGSRTGPVRFHPGTTATRENKAS